MSKPNRLQLEEYECHKHVRAAQIVHIVGDVITIEGPNDFRATFTAEPVLFSRYRPVIGDWYVVYEDGYESFSPKKAFEDGYHLFNADPTDQGHDGAGRGIGSTGMAAL